MLVSGKGGDREGGQQAQGTDNKRRDLDEELKGSGSGSRDCQNP